LGDDVEMNPKEAGYEGGDTIYLTPNKVPWRILVNMVKKLRVP
jgi:hypothetical protein